MTKARICVLSCALRTLAEGWHVILGLLFLPMRVWGEVTENVREGFGNEDRVQTVFATDSGGVG